MNLRHCVLALLAAASFSTASAKTRTFEGAWEVPWCGEGVATQCGGFYLYLAQRGNRLCGNHTAATADIGRLNEGAPKSVIGTVVGNTAIVVITSGRSGASFLARAELSGFSLRWRLLEQLSEGAEGESALIATNARLSPSKAVAALAQVTSECEEHFAREL